MTGKNIMTLAKIENITTNGGFVNSYNDSISKFKSRFSESDIIYDNSSIIVAKNGEDNIGLIIEQNGSTKMTTYFVTNNNENEIVGVSYIKSSDYMTFCFKINKDTLEVIGKTFKYDVYDLDYNSTASTHLLSEVSGDNKNFNYGEKTGIEYKESGDNGASSKFAYLEKFSETVAIRYAIKPIRENASKISDFDPKSSARATVNITEALNNYDTLDKVKRFIGCETIADFNKLTGAQQILNNQKVSDSVVSNGIINMSVAQKNNLIIGLAVETADVTMKVNGKQQTFKDNTQIWFVVDPTSKAIAAFAYSNTGDANSSGTYIFRISSDGTELEGKSFWNDQESYFPNVTYKGNDSIRNSFFTGDAEQLVYTLYKRKSRKDVEGSVIIKYDGTFVK